MPDVIIFGDTVRSPELRHEVPITVPDPFVYLERNGTRTEFSIFAPGPTGARERLASGYWAPALGEARERAAVESIRRRCRPAAARQLFEAVNATPLTVSQLQASIDYLDNLVTGAEVVG